MRQIHFNFCHGVAERPVNKVYYACMVNWLGKPEIALLAAKELKPNALYAIRVKPKV